MHGNLIIRELVNVTLYNKIST